MHPVLLSVDFGFRFREGWALFALVVHLGL